MVREQISKGSKTDGNPSGITIGKYVISFGAKVVEAFKGKKFIEVQRDVEKKEVYFIAKDSSEKAFTLSPSGKSKTGRMQIHCKAIQNSAKNDSYEAKFEKNEVVISGVKFN